jgi:hypothetical protein
LHAVVLATKPEIMTDIAAIVGISALCMVLIAVITSSDFPMPVPRPRAPPRNLRGAIELPPFGQAWRGLYDGLDVPEHLRRALPPPAPDRDLKRVPIVHVGPYR